MSSSLPIVIEVIEPFSTTNITCDIPSKITGDLSINNLESLNQVLSSLPSIHEQLAIINKTVSGIPDGSYEVALVGSLSSVLAAFVFNLFYWRRIDKKKKLSSRIDEYLVALDTFEKVATEYWLFPYHKRHTKKISLQEMRIISNLTLLRKSTNKLADTVPSNFLVRVIAAIPFQFFAKLKVKVGNCRQNDARKELIAFSSRIFDITTNDDYGSISRKEDLKKVNSIITECTKIKMFLSGLSD